jgi:hypothetical protein
LFLVQLVLCAEIEDNEKKEERKKNLGRKGGVKFWN